MRSLFSTSIDVIEASLVKKRTVYRTVCFSTADHDPYVFIGSSDIRAIFYFLIRLDHGYLIFRLSYIFFLYINLGSVAVEKCNDSGFLCTGCHRLAFWLEVIARTCLALERQTTNEIM